MQTPHINMFLEQTLSLSEFSDVNILQGDSAVGLDYADVIIVFGEEANKTRFSDHLRQQCREV